MYLDAEFASLFNLYGLGEFDESAITLPSHATGNGFAAAHDCRDAAPANDLAGTDVQMSGQHLHGEHGLAVGALQGELAPTRTRRPETGKILASTSK